MFERRVKLKCEGKGNCKVKRDCEVMDDTQTKTRASESVDGWLNAGSSESVKASEIASQTVKSQVAPGDNPQAPRMMTPRL